MEMLDCQQLFLNSDNMSISNKAHFEITEIDKNIGLQLAVTPLTESGDKYLCLYLQLPPEMRTDEHQQIISKLTNVIQ